MKQLLVTGGAGFIGSNLIANLLAEGNYKITCLDNFDPYYPRQQKEMNIRPFLTDRNFTLIEGDLCHPRLLARIGAIDAIVHLAARAGVRHSLLHPDAYNKVNVEGTRNLLDFARSRNIKQFIFSSSSSVYGRNPCLPWQEKEDVSHVNPYSQSKATAEDLGRLYSSLYGIRFLALRFFTVYGPSQRPDQAIHTFLDLSMKECPIQVYGDGRSSRDYTYVSDIVEGIKAAITFEDTGFDIINLGNNKPIPLYQLISLIEKVSGRKIHIDYQPTHSGEARHTCADISKAEALLNYHPSIDLETGIKAFYNWFINHRCISSRLRA